MMKWKFICPGCHRVISVQEYKDANAPIGVIGFSCIGRYDGHMDIDAFGGGGKGCNYAGGGLIYINPIKVGEIDAFCLRDKKWLRLATTAKKNLMEDEMEYKKEPILVLYGIIGTGINILAWMATTAFYGNTGNALIIRLGVLFLSLLLSIATIIGGYKILKYKEN